MGPERIAMLQEKSYFMANEILLFNILHLLCKHIKKVG
jgi:hypothetical protein